MALTIATWNINSVRLRIDLVCRFLAAASPDVLCLQETKAPDAVFPREAIEAAGYRQMLVRGMKGYNGVAILSRLPLEPLSSLDWCAREDCRHVAARLPGGIDLHNFYVPAGGDLPDPEANPKFAHKLRFLDEVTEWLGARGPAKATILVGDLNIAPLENDVWSHKALLTVVSHTPVEVAKLGALRAAGGLVDAVRHFVPAERRLYSWWSYRARDWAASDRGRRLDHVWVSEGLVGNLAAATIHREARGWDRASDHVPVLVRLGA
jgi:exodeoxyribonuclease III